MKLQDAVKEFILDSQQGAWSIHELKILVNCLHDVKHWKGQPLNVKTGIPYPSYENKIINRLHESLLVKRRNSVLIPIGRQVSDEETLNAEYPYAYFGFLSAMEHYGLTDRLPNRYTLVVPTGKEIRETIARDFYKKKFASFNSSRIDAILLNIVSSESDSQIRDGLEGSVIFSSKYEERVMKGIHLPRYVSKGRLFIDMLDRPDLCGGLDHVLDIFIEHADENKTQIISALKQASISDLARVRIGFVLSELCGIKSDDVLALKKYKKRGSSSRLYAGEPFSSKYIALEWDLSLNIERPEFERFRYKKMG